MVQLRTASSPAITRTINDLAGPCFGIVTAERLRAAHVTRNAVQRRVANGQMRVVAPGVYAVGHAALHLPLDAWRFAMVCAAGGVAALGGESAAQRLGLWARASERVDVVSATRPRLRRSIPDVRFTTRSDLTPSAIVLVDGMPCTDATHSIVDMADTATAHQVAHVVHEAFVARSLERHSLDQLIDRRRTGRGIATVRHALDLFDAGSAGTRSRTEDRLLAALLAHFLPLPLVNSRMATLVRGVEVDFAWPRTRLVVEVDGSSHRVPGAAERDRARDEALAADGWRVLRFSAHRIWHDLDRVVREIAAALA